jgi:hypothetical protein
MYEDIFKPVEFALKAMATLCVVFVPLGAWKLVEIIIWLCRHVKVSF